MAKIIRKVGNWTFKKLDMLKEYLRAYVNATKKARGHGIYYIDLFAGCGKNQHKSTREVKNGSPLIALGLQPGFHKYFFIEGDKLNCDSLAEYVGEYTRDLQERVSVYCGDCNVEIDGVLAEIPQRSPTFAFLDPESTELWWTTIQKLAAHKKPPNNKIELLILFPYNMSLVRMLTQDTTVFYGKGYHEIVERVMPQNSSWQEIYNAKLSGHIDKNELRRRFVREYENGLRSLGYRHVPSAYLFRSDVGRPLYFLLFASDHPLGEKIMVSRFRKPRHGEQLSMMDYAERY